MTNNKHPSAYCPEDDDSIYDMETTHLETVAQRVFPKITSKEIAEADKETAGWLRSLQEKHREKPRQGWLNLVCESCGCRWRMASRDVYSPSQEICPKCNDLCLPQHTQIDETLKLDEWGNLT